MLVLVLVRFRLHARNDHIINSLRKNYGFAPSVCLYVCVQEARLQR